MSSKKEKCMTPFNTFDRLNGIYHMSGQYLFQTSFQITNRANKFRAMTHIQLFGLNWGASFRWSFGPLSTWGSIESTIIFTTHPSLKLRTQKNDFNKIRFWKMKKIWNISSLTFRIPNRIFQKVKIWTKNESPGSDKISFRTKKAN